MLGTSNEKRAAPTLIGVISARGMSKPTPTVLILDWHWTGSFRAAHIWH